MPKIIRTPALRPNLLAKYIYARQGFYVADKAAARPDSLDLTLVRYFFIVRQKQRLN